MSTFKKIIVGLSGGVDSAVAALLLKKCGHELVGIYMQNWEADRDNPHCHAEQDLSDACAVCDQLQIPFQHINFSKEYWNNVFQVCLDEFAAGRTPNPDIWCNKEIKFNVFLNHALQQGADYLATGHYVRRSIDKTNDPVTLLKGLDQNKDQSYFLYTLTQNALSHALFPLGELEKSTVRQIAKEAGLINHDKKDSTGICFIGERPFKNFLSEYLLAKPGPILTPEGKTMGQHDGLMFYTRGQRKGLNIGGQRDEKEDAWYVLDKNLDENILVVGQGHDHPLLYASQLICNQLHWISGETPKTPLTCQAKTRYRQADQSCAITRLNDSDYQVIFTKPQRAITPGQSIVFYQNDICLGGGIINTYVTS